jgi:Tol biopolymer transport system component/DNA-binding winged helix-turn-helix (wHTH) protein
MATYEFGPFRLDPAERLLLRGQQPISLKPKAFDLLVLLVERHGRLLTKRELMDALWPATSVEEGNLTHTISALRRALGDRRDGDQFIETVPTRGYRFVSAVREQPIDTAAQPDSPVAPAARGWGIRTPLSAVTVLVAVVAGGALWWLIGPPKGSAISADHILTRLTADASLTAYPAISPDGARVAYASDRGGENLDIWVQQIAGGDAIKLTQDPADDYEPAFSPDDTRIAFRSNREGGGIYMVSALGGEAKLIVPRGRRPRFSPDGQWLAYWVGHEHLLGQTYVVPVAGGQPRKVTVPVVAEDQPWNAVVSGPPWETRSPVWLPDGKRLLVVGGAEWWIAPLDGGPAITTGAVDILRAANLRTPAADVSAPLLVPEAWDSGGGEVIFSAVSGDSRNLWRMIVNPETGLAAGPPRRFTFGTEWEVQASNSGGARTAFASISRSSNLWWLSVDANTARVSGHLYRLTQEGRHLVRPDISLDGRILVYADEGSKGALRLRHLEDGTETNALDSDQNRYVPSLTGDGSRVLYTAGPDLRRLDRRSPEDFSIHTISASGSVPTTICAACGPGVSASAYSPTGDRVAYTTAEAVMQFDMNTRTAKRIAASRRPIPGTRDHQGVSEMRYSPDGRWLAFHTVDSDHRAVFLIDVTRTDGTDAEWIPAIAEPSTSDARVAWSPDGNLLYFVSDRDGFRCIWAQRLESGTKRPVDRPFAVYHSHQTSRRIHHAVGRVGLAVARDKIVVALEELRGNVWMLEPRVSASGQPARD